MNQGFASEAGVDFWRQKSSYAWFLPVQTRWKDNDQYLHMNNAVYHAVFDSVINVYLIRYLDLWESVWHVYVWDWERGFLIKLDLRNLFKCGVYD